MCHLHTQSHFHPVLSSSLVHAIWHPGTILIRPLECRGHLSTFRLVWGCFPCYSYFSFPCHVLETFISFKIFSSPAHMTWSLLPLSSLQAYRDATLWVPPQAAACYPSVIPHSWSHATSLALPFLCMLHDAQCYTKNESSSNFFSNWICSHLIK